MKFWAVFLSPGSWELFLLRMLRTEMGDLLNTKHWVAGPNILMWRNNSGSWNPPPGVRSGAHASSTSFSSICELGLRSKEGTSTLFCWPHIGLSWESVFLDSAKDGSAQNHLPWELLVYNCLKTTFASVAMLDARRILTGTLLKGKISLGKISWQIMSTFLGCVCMYLLIQN